MTNIPHDKRSTDFGSAFAVQDHDTMRILGQTYDFTNIGNDSIIDQFIHEYDLWIKSGTLNTFTGLEDFKFKCYSNGTSESFDKFYMRNSKRRFRCFKGEYMYHKLAWRNHFDWQWLEDDDLDTNDAVVISLPFADTGDKHSGYNDLMINCSALGIPVLVDCAYYGICRQINIEINYPCITDVTFSLSKTFPVAHARIGMRYTKVDDDDTMFVYHKVRYNNKVGAIIGLEYLKNFTADYIPDKYIDKQKEFCYTLGVKASKTVLFGIDDTHKYDQYNRGGPTNRLSFHRQYIKGL